MYSVALNKRNASISGMAVATEGHHGECTLLHFSLSTIFSIYKIKRFARQKYLTVVLHLRKKRKKEKRKLPVGLMFENLI